MSEKAITGSIDTLLQLGVPGIVIMALAFACYRLFKLYADTQEKRITEARESIKAVEENTRAIGVLSELVKARRD